MSARPAEAYKAYRCRFTMEITSWGKNAQEARDNARAIRSLVDVEHDTHGDEDDWLAYPKPHNARVTVLRREPGEDVAIEEEYDFE